MYQSVDRLTMVGPIYVAVTETPVKRVLPVIRDGAILDNICYIYVNEEKFEVHVSPDYFIQQVLKADIYDARRLVDKSGEPIQDTGEFFS